MKRQVVIIGLGRFGISLASTLYELGHDVLVIDIDEKKVQSIATKITHAVQADATDEAVLRDLGVANFDIAIVAIGSAIQSSVLCTILLKMLGVPYIIARADNELHGSILDKIGADRVVYPERGMGIRVAHGLTLRGIMEYMQVSGAYGIVKVMAPAHFIGNTLTDIGCGPKGKLEIAVLLIKREKEMIVTPESRQEIESGDILILAGNDNNLRELLTAPEKPKNG